MPALFSSPPKAPAPPPPAPVVSDTTAQTAAAQAAAKRKQGLGYQSTILGNLMNMAGAGKQTFGS